MVVVHDSELLGEPNNAAGTTRRQLSAKAFKEVLSSCSAATGGRGSTDVATEELGSEFLIIDSAANIRVVTLEERVKVLIDLVKAK